MASRRSTDALDEAFWLAMFMGMSWRAVNVADLKNRLSEYLDAVERGSEITICRRNIPFAKITAIPLRRNRTRLGFDRGKIRIFAELTGPALPESDWRDPNDAADDSP